MMRRLLLTLLSCLGLFACPPEINTNDAGVAMVGPNGGIFVFENVGVGIDVPKGALETESRIEVTVIDTGIPEVPGRKRISFGYRFSPQTLTFKAPIKIFLPWQEDRVPAAVDPSTFDMRRQTTMDPYLALSGVNVRPEFKNLEAQTERLGLFWLTSPSEPNIAQLTLDPTEAFLRKGGTQQFTAVVEAPTGGTLDVPITWSCVPPRVCELTDAGLFTAKEPGWATVTAKAGSQTQSAQIRVQGDAVGPTTFVHENPFPTNNDLWGGAVLPGGLGEVFVGSNGTVLARDGAGNFTRLFSTPGVTLKAIGGTSLANAAAVGTTGSVGVLVEMGAAAPTVKTFDTIDPRAMWFDGTHGMAVGYGNDVLVRREGAWVKEYSPSVETLLSVVGDGMGGFVTLGDRGSIYQFDPVTKTWNSLYQTQLSVLLTAGVLVSADGGEAWAASINKLWHFENGGWASVNLPVFPRFNAVTTIGLDGDKLIIGARSNQAGFVFTFDPAFANFDAGTPDPIDAGADDGGGSDAGVPLEPGWSVVTLRSPQRPLGYFASGATAFVVGEAGAIYRVQAGALSELSRGFYGDVAGVAVKGTDVFAAVNECSDSTCATRVGSVFQRTGPGQFALVGGMAQPFGTQLFSIAAKDNDVVVGTFNAVYRWDGASWQSIQVSGGVTGPVLQLKFCGSQLLGVGVGGAFYRGTATNMSRQPNVGGNDLWSLHCPTDNSVWVAGDTFLAERVGSGAWSAKASAEIIPAPWRAVWSPGVGEAFTFGDARYGMYFNTVALTAIDMPGGVSPDFINAMWGSSIDNLYLVGNTQIPAPFGIALRFDGADFRLIDSGSQRTITSVDGSGPLEVWLGTQLGGVMRGVKP